jgi:hypothetical protein
MRSKKYSAGAVKLSFWFTEFRKVISLLHSGKTMKDIKELALNDNIFSAATPLRSKQVFDTVSMRVSALSDAYYEVFENGSLETQKLITLIAIMNTDILFFCFLNEVYSEKLIIGDSILTSADLRVFFMNKQRESEKVARWTDATLTRLQNCYKTYLTEAGLLERGVGDRKIIKPLIDNGLAELLADSNMRSILNALTGMR